MTPERKGYIKSAMKFAEDFPDGAFMQYMEDCGITVKELEEVQGGEAMRNYPIYPTRRIGTYPQTVVRQNSLVTVYIEHYNNRGHSVGGMWVLKSEIRLLSRRLLQVLKAWK